MENQDHSEEATIKSLKQYARSNCKKCNGRGYGKMVKRNVEKEWVFDRYDICVCVLRGKKFPALWGKVKEAAKMNENSEERKNIEQILIEKTKENIMLDEVGKFNGSQD